MTVFGYERLSAPHVLLEIPTNIGYRISKQSTDYLNPDVYIMEFVTQLIGKRFSALFSGNHGLGNTPVGTLERVGKVAVMAGSICVTTSNLVVTPAHADSPSRTPEVAPLVDIHISGGIVAGRYNAPLKLVLQTLAKNAPLNYRGGRVALGCRVSGILKEVPLSKALAGILTGCAYAIKRDDLSGTISIYLLGECNCGNQTKETRIASKPFNAPNKPPKKIPPSDELSELTEEQHLEFASAAQRDPPPAIEEELFFPQQDPSTVSTGPVAPALYQPIQQLPENDDPEYAGHFGVMHSLFAQFDNSNFDPAIPVEFAQDFVVEQEPGTELTGPVVIQ